VGYWVKPAKAQMNPRGIRLEQVFLNFNSLLVLTRPGQSTVTPLPFLSI
jgi:hypothetical protein